MKLTNILRASAFASFLIVSMGAPDTAEAALAVPAPPKIDARAYVLRDHHSGRILVEHNADERLDPASLTKMMTAYAIFVELKEGNISLQDQVTISEKAWRTGGSRTFVEVDRQVPVEVLLKGVIVQSGNDASVALAEHVAGDEAAFAQLMNQYAKRLGMQGTNFVNSTGLPAPDHYSTARDLAILGSALIHDHPDFYPWHAIREFDYNGITQYNRNKLLRRDASVDGIKTGHTQAAGYCLAASAVRDGMRLLSVVMGADSVKDRTRQSQALLTYGFRFYETHRLYGANEAVAKVRVWKGDVSDLGIGVLTDLYVTVPRGQYQGLAPDVRIDDTIVAPVAKGDARGSVKVKLGEEIVVSQPLVALHTVGEGALWRRMLDRVLLMFE